MFRSLIANNIFRGNIIQVVPRDNGYQILFVNEFGIPGEILVKSIEIDFINNAILVEKDVFND